MLISEDDVTETDQDLQAGPDPGYRHEVNVIVVFLEHCMSFCHNLNGLYIKTVHPAARTNLGAKYAKTKGWFCVQ